MLLCMGCYAWDVRHGLLCMRENFSGLNMSEILRLAVMRAMTVAMRLRGYATARLCGYAQETNGLKIRYLKDHI